MAKKSKEHEACEAQLKEVQELLKVAQEEIASHEEKSAEAAKVVEQIDELRANHEELTAKLAECEDQLKEAVAANSAFGRAEEERAEADEALTIERERTADKIERLEEHIEHLEAINKDHAAKVAKKIDGALDVADPIPTYEELRAAGMEAKEASDHVEKAYGEAGTSFGGEKKLAYRVVGPKNGFWRIKRKFTLDPTTIPLSELSEEEIAELKGTPAKFISVQLVRI